MRVDAKIVLFAGLLSCTALPASAQYGAQNGEWRYYGGDAGRTKYSHAAHRGRFEWR